MLYVCVKAEKKVMCSFRVKQTSKHCEYCITVYIQKEYYFFNASISFCTFALYFQIDVLLHVYLISFSFFQTLTSIMARGNILFPDLGQQRSSLLSPSQLAAADFHSGSCLLAQTGTYLIIIIIFLFLLCATLCPNFLLR